MVHKHSNLLIYSHTIELGAIIRANVAIRRRYCSHRTTLVRSTHADTFFILEISYLSRSLLLASIHDCTPILIAVRLGVKALEWIRVHGFGLSPVTPLVRFRLVHGGIDKITRFGFVEQGYVPRRRALIKHCDGWMGAFQSI